MLPSGKNLVICPNHFKSKRGGDNNEAQARRLAQGKRVAEIGRLAEAQISPLVLLAGDLNDTPDSPAITRFWRTDVRYSISSNQLTGKNVWTGTAHNKIDYLIMSSALKKKLVGVGIERRGTYHPKAMASFDGVTAITEASDHHCICRLLPGKSAALPGVTKYKRIFLR